MKNRKIKILLASVLVVTSLALMATNLLKDDDAFINMATQEQVSFQSIHNKGEYTYLYVWTSWCGGCIATIKNQIPRETAKLDSMGVDVNVCAVLFSGKANEKLDTLMQNARNSNIETYMYKTYLPSGLQKIQINNVLRGNLKDYEGRNFVPIKLLIDRKGNIIMDGMNENITAKSIVDKIKKDN